ncbi:SatD family protein [Microbacterium sp. BK668]|uniref:SatD family protein n=1 Tax=Microbacterium sp. BK668 TaxID=2512118 RepID=UPI00105E15C7|nr:SatD family protein [Microbacterium sp. BK668]TDN88675.1 SatD family protein [Microbacterium sp. BK668]
MVIATIADIVGSRRLADRADAQRILDSAIADVERRLPLAVEPLRPTVGDELQGVYARLEDALASLLLVQLTLPDGVECRFGLGIGPVDAFESASGRLQDGPGWWAARSAIETVHAKQQRAAPSARTWVVASPDEDADVHTAAALANSYLLARDQLVGGMNDRARRLTLGRCLGRTQRDLAQEEGVTQPAVSQALATAGAAAVIEGFRMLRGAA